MTQLTDKIALITGAAAPRGIGAAIARRLAQDGATVILTDQIGEVSIAGEPRDRLSLLDERAAEITAFGGKAQYCGLDVSSGDDINARVAELIGTHGRIDILVNNAGSLAGSDHFLATSPEQWTTSFQVNLLGPMMLAQAVIPSMCETGDGRIINIGSTGSLGAEPGFGAYTAMKHGLVGLSKTIAAEFGPQGIRCNTVCPGFIMTDMHAAANERLAGEAGVSIEEMKERRYANVALRDAGLPEDVAQAVAYLAGPAGAYVTGINLPVSGGVPFGI